MAVVTVELFSSNLCENCTRAKSMVDDETAQLGEAKFEVRHIDVLENIDRAVALGVLATPAIVIDGKLIFTGLPKARVLRKALAEYARGV